MIAILEQATAMNAESGPQPEFMHEPILRDRVVELLAVRPGQLVVDGTLGGGGHAEAFLRAGARVVGIDQDPEAIVAATNRLAAFGGRFHAVHANFADVDAVLDNLCEGEIDAGFLDIGVSSWQLDSARRGFSFLKEGPLDMRMDPDAPTSAADIVNSADSEDLADILWKFGEERAARRLAAQIVKDREKRPLVTTLDLVASVEKVLPRRGKTHPATRAFQALRIAVNRELEVLEAGLTAFAARLRDGGRLGVLTFHSLEDRIVKSFFRQGSMEWLDRPEWPEPRRNPAYIFKRITLRPVVPGREEQRRNPRSRSARLRVVEKISHGTQS